MAPMFGSPYQEFFIKQESSEYNASDADTGQIGLTQMAFWYMLVLIAMLLLWLILFFCLRIIALRQKTRNPQQRRGYMGTRTAPTLTPSEPTIYVSPANLPPPPKYEAMAPPSYEEVVGIHYPGYRLPVQPITQPLTTAMAHNATIGNNSNDASAPPPSTVITVTTDDTRTSVNVATS